MDSDNEPDALRYLDGTPHAPRAAREIVTTVLGADAPHLGKAKLVASELVTNALRHSRSGHPNGVIEFRIKMAKGSGVRLEVTDNGALPGKHPYPALQQPPCLRESGFGLELVSAFAQDWGVIHNNGSCTVWALIGHEHDR